MPSRVGDKHEKARAGQPKDIILHAGSDQSSRQDSKQSPRSVFAGAAAIVFGQKGATSDTEQVTVILKHTNKNRLGAIDWGPNDFDVLAEGRCVGRIFTSRQFWTITAREYPLTNP